MTPAPRAKDAFAVKSPTDAIVIASIATSEPDAVHRFMQCVSGDRHWLGWAERGWSIVPVRITEIREIEE